MTQRWWRVTALALAAGALMAAAGVVASVGPAHAAGKLVLRIGFPAALSGPYAAYDVPTLNGMKFAEKQINAMGGIGGVTVQVTAKDNKGQQALTATTTQELLDSGIKVFLLTAADPSIASGLIVVGKGGIASVGANTAPEIVKDVGQKAFMLVAGDNVQASVGAQYACSKGYRKAYVIGSPEIPYTKNIPLYFADAFKHDCGGKITGKDTYKIGSTDYGVQVTKVQHASPKPDLIYSSMFVPDTGVFLKQLRAAGVKLPYVTVDGNDSTLLASSGGKAVDGVVYTTHGFPKAGTPMGTFFKQYQQLMHKKPESNTTEAIGRDNVYALVTAAARAHSTDPDKVLAQVMKFKNLQLLTGALTMDQRTRVPVKPMTLILMKGKTPTFLEAIKPKYVAKP
jgi:branched-chain amino acid transport system substrate-binding protein